MRHPHDENPDYLRSSHDHYDRDQPRVPRGHPNGGQWTSGGYRPLSELAELPAPDLRSLEAQQSVPGAYERLAMAGMQVPVPRPGLPPFPQPLPPPRRHIPPTRSRPPVSPTPPREPEWLSDGPSGVAATAIALGLWTLYQWLSGADSEDEHLIVGVAREFRRGADPVHIVHRARINRKEAKNYCPDIEKIQDLLDIARSNIGSRDSFNGTASEYGKAVDKEFKRLVAEENATRLSVGKPEIFIIDQTFSVSGGDDDRKPNSDGAKTPDVWQRRGINACVYEVTTGEGVNHARMLAIVHNMMRDKSTAGIINFIVMRVRPSTAPPTPKGLH